MANKRKHTATSGLFSLRLWIGKKLFGAVGPHGVRVSPNRMIKGPCASPELAALEYVAEHTSIPVPKVFNAHYYDDHLYIEMEYIRGMSLEAAWYRPVARPEEMYHHRGCGLHQSASETKTSARRNSCISKLQRGPRSPSRILRFRPFTNHQGFHSYLRANLPIEDCNEVIGPEVTKYHSRRYRSCFTHADIAPRNIMVDNGKVSAIVDWEFSGWYPEYWEYTKAHYGQIDRPEWYDGLENAMQKYDDELKTEQTLWRRLDEPQLLWRGREHLIPNLGLA